MDPLLEPLSAPPSPFPAPVPVEPPQPPSTIRGGTNIVARMRIALLMSSPPRPGVPGEHRVPSGRPEQAVHRSFSSTA